MHDLLLRIINNIAIRRYNSAAFQNGFKGFGFIFIFIGGRKFLIKNNLQR
jgi:hypothetical protein